MSLMHAVLHLYMKYEAKIETKGKWVNLRGQSQTIETPVSQSPEVGEAEQRGTKDSTTPTLRAGNLWENITIHTFRPTCLIFCLISEPVRPMKTFSCCWHILFHSSLEPWLIGTLFLVSALFPCFLLTCRDFYLASCFLILILKQLQGHTAYPGRYGARGGVHSGQAVRGLTQRNKQPHALTSTHGQFQIAE